MVFKLQKSFTKRETLVIIAAAFLPWLPVIFTSFLNDDYQIIGFHQNVNFFSLLKPFYSADISGFYWRPLGNFLHALTLLLFGFTPFAFRLGNLLLYSLCCFQLSRASLKLGLTKNAALITALLFAVIPSHSYMIGWVASKGEFLLTFLILLSIQYYFSANEKDAVNKRALKISVLYFAAALLVKELAFAMVFIPALYFIVSGVYDKKSARRALAHTAAAAAIVLTALAVRFVVVGGVPFSSPHFQNKNVFSLIKNFFIYIVISFVNPELIESLYAHKLAALVLAASIAAAVIVLLAGNRKIIFTEKRNLLLGAGWYVVFIIPVLPILMRWYPFTASIGLVWIIAVVYDKLFSGKKYFYPVLFFVIAALAICDFTAMLDWYSAGKKMDNIVAGIKSSDSFKEKDSILVLASPDKVKDIPLMKLGVQQTFQYALKRNVEVFAPLRAELNSNQARIEITGQNGNTIRLKITGGLFLPEGDRPDFTNPNGELSADVNNVKIKITNTNRGSNSSVSNSEIYIDERYKNYLIVYFNGQGFTPVTKR
jgi:hypothetical protein